MNRLLRIITYVFCFAQLGFVISQLPGISHNADILTAILLLCLPVFAIAALVTGPDREEVKLKKEVTKARLKNELEELGKKSKEAD